VLLLVGCGTARELPLAATAPAPVSTRPRLNPPDTLAIGLANEPSTLAAPPGDGETARFVGQLVFSQLVALDDKLEPRADLAAGVPTIENGARWIGDGETRQLQVTFKLRPGARWSDGQPVRANDVLFTWQMALNPAFAATIGTERRYEKVEAPDDATVVFTFFSERSARAAAARQPNRYGFLRDQRGPVVDPLYVYGLPNWWIYPAHVLGPLLGGAGTNAPDLLATGGFARRPIGSGPYRADTWSAGNGYGLVARDDYWGGAPKIPRFVVRAGTADLVRSGAIDLLIGATMAELAPTPALRVERVPDLAWERLDLNLDAEPLKDRTVREALLLAIDRPALARAAGGTVVDGLPPASRPRAAPRAVDLARAGQLLDAAGWALAGDGVRVRGGKRLLLRLLTTDAPGRAQLAGRIAQSLAQVGVEVRLEARPPAELFDRVNGPLARRGFDLALYASTGDLDPLGDAVAWYGSRAIPTRANAFSGDNLPGLRSPEVDRIADEAAIALDPRRRGELLRALGEAVAAELPTIPLFAHPSAIAADARLRGAQPVPGLIGVGWNAATWEFR
jgi:peptide/nickel transport system substrate-binding protein